MTKGPEQGRIAYPASPHPLSMRDLKQLFTPWPDQTECAVSATWAEEGRLGLLTLLKVFETLGRFIPSKEIPPEVVPPCCAMRWIDRERCRRIPGAHPLAPSQKSSAVAI